MSITNHDPFIFGYIKRFRNICAIDPSITIEDLWAEAYLIHAKLQKTKLSCEFLTALGRQIEQRFTDLYRVAKRLNSNLDRSQFIENLSTRKAKISKLQFEELPDHVKQLVKRIYENPEEIAEHFPKNHVGKAELIKYLTKELSWQRKEAINFAANLNRTQKKPTLKRDYTAI